MFARCLLPILSSGLVLILASWLPSPVRAQDNEKKGTDKEPALRAAGQRQTAASLVTVRLGSVKEAGDVSFSPDGRFLYTSYSDRDKNISRGQIWAMPDLKKVVDILPHQKNTDALEISRPLYHPRMSFAVTTTRTNWTQGGYTNNLTKVWSLPDWKVRASLPKVRTDLGAISADGRFLVAYISPPTNRFVDNIPQGMAIWTIPDGKFVKMLPKEFPQAGERLFSPTALVLATGYTMTPEELDANPALKSLGQKVPKTSLWSIPEGKLLATLPGGYPIGFAPDGRTLACYAPKGGLQLWSAPQGKLLASFGNDEAKLVYYCDAVLSPNGQYVAYRNMKSTRVWSVRDRKPMATIDSKVTVTQTTRELSFSPDGRLLATTHDNPGHPCRIWSIPNGKLLWTQPYPDVATRGYRGSCFFSPDGRTFAIVESNQLTGLWLYAQGESVDWSLDKAIAGTKPRAEATLSKSVSVYAGDRLSLELTVRNRGDADLMQLWATASADSPQLRHLTCLIGRVKPDTSIERRFGIVLDAAHETGKFKGTLVLREGKTKGNAPDALPFVIEVKPLPRPDFTLTTMPEDLGSKKSTARLKRGKTLEIPIAIKNQTGSAIVGLRATLRVLAGHEHVEVTQEGAVFETLANGENGDGRVAIRAKGDAAKGVATCELRAEDAEGRVFAVRQFELPIDSASTGQDK